MPISPPRCSAAVMRRDRARDLGRGGRTRARPSTRRAAATGRTNPRARAARPTRAPVTPRSGRPRSRRARTQPLDVLDGLRRERQGDDHRDPELVERAGHGLEQPARVRERVRGADARDDRGDLAASRTAASRALDRHGTAEVDPGGPVGQRHLRQVDEHGRSRVGAEDDLEGEPDDDDDRAEDEGRPEGAGPRARGCGGRPRRSRRRRRAARAARGWWCVLAAVARPSAHSHQAPGCSGRGRARAVTTYPEGSWAAAAGAQDRGRADARGRGRRRGGDRSECRPRSRQGVVGGPTASAGSPRLGLAPVRHVALLLGVGAIVDGRWAAAASVTWCPGTAAEPLGSSAPDGADVPGPSGAVGAAADVVGFGLLGLGVGGGDAVLTTTPHSWVGYPDSPQTSPLSRRA